MATGTSASDHSTSTAVGEKLFYKIGEVSKLTGLPSYVLRFWESEFQFLQPQKAVGVSGSILRKMWRRFFRSNGCATSRDLPLKDFVAVGIPDKGPRNESRRARPRKS